MRQVGGGLFLYPLPRGLLASPPSSSYSLSLLLLFVTFSGLLILFFFPFCCLHCNQMIDQLIYVAPSWAALVLNQRPRWFHASHLIHSIYLFFFFFFFFLLSKIQLWLNHQWATTELRLMIGIDNSVDCSGTPTPQRGRWIRMAVLGGAISVPSNEQRPSPYWCDDGGWQNGRFLMLLPRRWCWIAIDSGGSVSLFKGETKTFYVSGTARYQNFNLIIIERLKFESLRILTDSGFHPCRREGPFPSNSTDSFFEF